MSIFTKKPYTTGVLLGLAGFGIALYTTPVVLQFAATIGSYMSSFIGAVPALFAGLALTAGLCILAGVAAVLIALAIARCFSGAPKELDVNKSTDPVDPPESDTAFALGNP